MSLPRKLKQQQQQQCIGWYNIVNQLHFNLKKETLFDIIHLTLHHNRINLALAYRSLFHFCMCKVRGGMAQYFGVFS